MGSIKRSRGGGRSARTCGGSLLLLVCCSAAVGGCGAADRERPPAASTVARPSIPPAEQCAAPALAGASRPLEPGPRPGTYVYRVRGVETTVGQGREQRRLPGAMEVVVTPTRETETVSCFTVQQRFKASLVETATFATSATALYLRRVLLQTPTGAVAIEPAPPLLAVSARSRRWSGTFRGRTRGRYEGRVVERRTILVAGRRVKAARVVLDVTFRGEVTGWQRSDRWFEVRRNLLLRERVVERRRIGLDVLGLSYRAALDALAPRTRP